MGILLILVAHTATTKPRNSPWGKKKKKKSLSSFNRSIRTRDTFLLWKQLLHFLTPTILSQTSLDFQQDVTAQTRITMKSHYYKGEQLHPAVSK